MGTQKLLLPYAGGTVIGRVVGQLLESRVDRVFVVTAESEEQIAAAAAALASVNVTRVPNPDPDCEMLETIRCGLRALPPECEQILVALGDQPALSCELINRLLDESPADPPAIIVPVHGHKRGHPVLLHIAFKNDLLTRFDGEGLRGLLQAYPDRVREVPVPAQWMLTDMDCPEDYQRELSKLDAGRGAS
jgi:molybdenum cofactor cytidylyltransferase